METPALNPFGQGDQTSGKQKSAESGLADNFDNFLNILTTQLQNQDPLSPMKTQEFTKQLVMFSEVEQSVRQSGQLENLISLMKSNEAIGAVNYMDREIKAEHNAVNLKNGQAQFSYTLPEKAENASLQIYNKAGELVSIEDAETGAGTHQVTWDGETATGQQLPDGAYSFKIGAVNADDQPIEASYQTRGRVTGVEYGPDGAVLKMGDISVPMEKVLEVTNPAAS